MISQNFFQAIISWLLTHGIKVALILIAAFLINKISRKFIAKAVRKAIKGQDKESEKKREDTLIGIFSGVLRVVIWLIGIMTILPFQSFFPQLKDN